MGPELDLLIDQLKLVHFFIEKLNT